LSGISSSHQFPWSEQPDKSGCSICCWLHSTRFQNSHRRTAFVRTRRAERHGGGVGLVMDGRHGSINTRKQGRPRPFYTSSLSARPKPGCFSVPAHHVDLTGLCGGACTYVRACVITCSLADGFTSSTGHVPSCSRVEMRCVS
jgi:hypothetical protein